MNHKCASRSVDNVLWINEYLLSMEQGVEKYQSNKNLVVWNYGVCGQVDVRKEKCAKVRGCMEIETCKALHTTRRIIYILWNIECIVEVVEVRKRRFLGRRGVVLGSSTQYKV
jgi:hypothetical protein